MRSLISLAVPHNLYPYQPIPFTSSPHRANNLSHKNYVRIQIAPRLQAHLNENTPNSLLVHIYSDKRSEIFIDMESTLALIIVLIFSAWAIGKVVTKSEITDQHFPQVSVEPQQGQTNAIADAVNKGYQTVRVPFPPLASIS